MAYDEMELDLLGDRRTALFVIISDTDDTFNFVVSIMYTQLFNLLCDRADDQCGGQLKYHVRLLLDEFAKGQQTVNLFSGIVRCGGCGQNMVRRTVSKNGKKYIYLHCVTNHNGLGCSSHLISESKLAEVVLAALQGKVQQISGLEHRLDEINEIPKNERRLKSVEEHLKMLEQEEQKYQTLRRQLYEDMSSGIVSKEEYKEFSHSFNEKVETIRKAKAEMNRQRDCLNNLDVEHLPWIEDFKSYQNLTSLNRRVLVELVESITVYDKEHIHIQYRFDQEIRNVLEYCSSVPAAETEESAV